MSKGSVDTITDLSLLVAPPDLPLRDILARINATPHHFLLVIDGEDRLLGTITDGDIRRALLQLFDLSVPARFCMNAKPISGKVGEIRENLQKLQSVPAARPFLPVLDDDGCVLSVLVTERKPEAIKAALIMAGGEGRRLGAMTRTTPKPLLPVRGRPILDQLIERLEDSGIETIFISVRYLAEQIVAFVEQRANRADIRFLVESEPLGTGGAINLLPTDFRDHLLVVNGDVLTDIDFQGMKVFNDRHEFDGCLAVTRHQVTVPFGVIEKGKQGEFIGLSEKPTYTHLVSAGIYYLSPTLRALAPQGRSFDMPDILTLGAAAGLKIGLFPVHEKWRDMGRPNDFVAEQQADSGERNE